VYSADSDSYTHDLPPDSVPVDELSASGSILAFRGTGIAQQLESPLAPPMTFQDYTASLPQWDRCLLDAVTMRGCAGPGPNPNPTHLSSLYPTAMLLVTQAGALVAKNTEIYVSVAGTTEGLLLGSF
jgi:hypothetical protein